MKIILSRKEWDSSYGGFPSPVFSNRYMLSLPIPMIRLQRIAQKPNKTLQFYDNSHYFPISYSDIRISKPLHQYLKSKPIDLLNYRDLIDNLLLPKTPKERGIS